jgi:pimeloyl-ACP methyl ester carboxylesterase
MALIHHVATGQGGRPIVFVHGFGCAHSDWDRQVAHFSNTHRTIAVDLRGHGASPGDADACSIERYGADVAEVMHALDLSGAVVVGHSLGCRVVIEAALQAPSRTAGVILVDGSQFAAAMQPVLQERFATPDGYVATIEALFQEMFTAKTDPALAERIADRARRLPQAVGRKMLPDLLRYDVFRLTSTLGSLRVPVMAIQATYTNEQRERRPLTPGQTTPYLDMVHRQAHSARIEVIAETGHFPQLDEPDQTNRLIGRFLEHLAAA